MITASSTINSDGSTLASLTLNASGANGTLVFNDAIGNTSGIGSLSASAANIKLNGAQVKTTGNQTFAGAVTLGAGITLTANHVRTTSGSTVSGAGNSLNVTGNTNLGGDVSGVNLIGVSGTTTLSGNVSSVGNQTYAGALTLGSNARLMASGNNSVIKANSTINSDDTARSLSITASGTNGSVVLNGALGNANALDNLAVTAGAITLSAGTIDTRGNQTYAGPITLTKDTTLQSFGADSSIAITQALNVDSSTARSLNISASGVGSSVTLGGPLGHTFGLSTLEVTGELINLQAGTVNTSGNQTYAGAVILVVGTTLTGSNVTTKSGSAIAGAGNNLNVTGNASLGGDVSNVSSFGVSGTTQLAGNVSSSGNQTYAGAMTLATNARLSSTGNAAVITSNGTINSDGNARSLNISASVINLNGGSVNTSGNQTYAGAVNLGASTTLTASNVATTSGSSIVGAGNRLNIAGNMSLGGDVSGVSSLDISGTSKIAASVSSSGNQTYAGAMTLANNVNLSAIGNAAVITSNGTINSEGTARSLNISASGMGGIVLLNKAVGNTATLASLNTAASAIGLNGGTVTTSGNQTLSGTVSLGANTTLKSSNVTTTAGSTVAGAGNSLTLTGNASLGGDVSGVSALGVSGTTKLAGNISSTGNQTYSGSITLANDVKLSASSNTAQITSNGTLNSDGTARNLNISATGTNATVAINQALGQSAALQSLNISARNINLNGGSVNTLGNQSYAGAMTLGANTTLNVSAENAAIATNGAINSDSATRNLAMSATGANAAILVNGALGNLASLGSVSVSANAIQLKGGSVKTTADQSYSGAVTLGRDITIQSSGVNSTLTFNGTLDSDALAARNLTVASGGGSTNLQLKGSVGASQALASFNNAAGNTQIGNALNGPQVAIHTLDNLLFDNNVQLLSPASFNVAKQAEINGVVSGPGALSKLGQGKLQLSNANQFTGNTTVTQGTLSISNALALGSPNTSVTVGSGAALELQGVAVENKPLIMQGGVLLASNSLNSWSGPINLTQNSQFDVAGQQLSVLGLINTAQSGLLVTGQGAVSMSNDANAISRIATSNVSSSVNVNNSVPMTVGEVSVGNLTYKGVQSAGAITLATTAPLTVAQGATIASAGGDVIVETSQWTNEAGATAVQATGTQKWQIWSTNSSPFVGSATDSANSLNNDYVHYNVLRSTAQALPQGNGLLFSYAPTAVASLQGKVVKIYDSNVDAQLAANNYKLVGAVNNDELTLNNPIYGTYVSSGTAATLQGAGLDKDVLVNGLVLTAIQAGKPVYGYQFGSSITGKVGEIQAKVLDLAITKVYEGNSQFDNADSYTLTNMVVGEAAPKINFGTATVESPNAGTYTKYSTTSFALDNPNYTLVGGAQLATIQQAPLGIAIKTLFKAKTELPDIAAKDFTVTGLQNGETIPKIDLLTLNFKDVSKNDENFVKAIAVSAGPGVANVANYVISQAVNPAANPLSGGTTMNMVKLISPDEIVAMPAAPPPALPAVVAPVASSPAPIASAVQPSVAAVAAVATATPIASATPAVAAPAAAATPATAAASTASSSTEVATSAQVPAMAAQPVIASNVTPGVTVSTVRQPTAQANGLVTVELPREFVNLGIIPLVIPLPAAIVGTPSAPTGLTGVVSVSLSNNQPLPDWIRYDATQKALVTTPDARATFPITVVITVGDQRTVVVVSEKPPST